jgi:putative membrane protein insertion efficiency factor
LKSLVIFLIRFYQIKLSPLKPKSCIYHPTCSKYAIEALEKYGLYMGFKLSIKRIFSCRHGKLGGYDPLP